MTGIFHIDFYSKDWLIKTQRLTLEERGVYIQVLAAIYEHGGPVDNDPQWLSNLCNCSVRKLKSVLNSLIDKGFLNLINEKISQERAEEELEKARKRRENASKNGRKSSEKKDESNKNNNITSTSHQSPITNIGDTNVSPTRARDTKHDFAEWYSRYPNKVGKKAAEKSYISARRQVDAATLLEGLHRYVSTKPPDRAWCNPATWLNQGRWDDQQQETDNAIARRSNKKYTADDALSEVLAEIDARERAADHAHGTPAFRHSGHLRQDAGAIENPYEHHAARLELFQTDGD